MSISPDQIKLMTSMADPKQLQKLKDNGLPTIDAAKIKELAEKKLEAQVQEMTATLSTAIGSMMAQADREIQNKIAEIEKLGKMASKVTNALPSKLSGLGGDAANKFTAEIDKLKQAKEHGMATGNFVPLMAILNPTVNLKNLMKDTVVLPKIPSIPSIGG